MICCGKQPFASVRSQTASKGGLRPFSHPLPNCKTDEKKRNLLDSDAVEPINEKEQIDSSSSNTDYESTQSAFFVSGESSLAPHEVSILNQEFESSVMSPEKENKIVISLRPEEIGIWLA